MPACTLYCDSCRSERVHDLDERAFAVMLEEGQVLATCDVCNRRTAWKLKLQERERQAKGPRTEPLHVLVIDDDKDTLQILTKMLAASGYRADVAESADIAMAKLQDQEFDVIVCDILMPGFTGPNLFRFLNVFMPEKAARVVFLTGDRSEKTLRFLEESGCPYTFKPINWPELRRQIAEVG